MLDYSQLSALLAVDESGTYEGAARELHVTSFAVKQRIKTLEAKLGVKLIDGGPTRPSKVGRILCDHTRKVRILEEGVIEEHRQDCLEEARQEEYSGTIHVAVCDEVFADWFIDALDALEQIETRPTIDVSPAPPATTVQMMRSGNVVAAITHHSQEVFGFKSYSLGTLSYCAVASPDYVARHFKEGITAETLAKAPCYRFCGNDDLAYEWVDKVMGKSTRIPITRYPSADGSLKACLEGHVWAMHPRYRVDRALASGDLIEILPNTGVERALCWLVAGAMTDTLKPITTIIRNHAMSLL